MNFWRDIKLVIAFLERQWYGLVLLIKSPLLYIAFVFYIHPVYAQLSAFDKAESFFYNKQYQNAAKIYIDIIQNEYSSKKDIAFSKCRLALINNEEKNINESQKYLEESLRENILPLSAASVCSYALLQVYFIAKNYTQAVNLAKELNTPLLNPVYLARFYAITAESARFVQNKEFELAQLKKLESLMKKENFQLIELNKYVNKNISLFDVTTRMSILSFDDTISSTFQDNYIENVFLSKFKEGNYQYALEILEKNIVKNSENIVLNTGLLINNSLLRSRLVRLIHDNPQEMRIGILLANKENRQEYNQNALRGVSAFLSSSAANGVNYTIKIFEVNKDGGSLSQQGLKLIFEDHVHSLIVTEGFSDLSDLLSLASLFSIPVILPEQQTENIFANNELKDISSLKMVSDKGRFKKTFEGLLQGRTETLKLEAKIFDALILLRNSQYLANGSQSAQLEKIIREGHWKVDGIAVYEGLEIVK